jgi:hypothetical protein
LIKKLNINCVFKAQNNELFHQQVFPTTNRIYSL